MSQDQDKNKLNLSLALVGSPNSGKTTLYNWLTDSKYKTVNYPGATVDYAIGSMRPSLLSKHSRQITFIDTPGVYSLEPASADEEVTYDILFSGKKVQRPDVIVSIVDGTHLHRHLLLAEQIKRSGYKLIIVITMSDLVKKGQLKIDVPGLEKLFSAPVILFNGLTGEGMEQISQAIEGFGSQGSEQIQKCERIDDSEKQSLQNTFKGFVQYGNEKNKSHREFTKKIDKWFLHPWLGLVLFALIMSSLFASVFWAAAPFMDLIDEGFAVIINSTLESFPSSMVADFVANGVLTAFASVLVFVPQIFILFLGIGFLEGSGYLSRAATIVDRPLAAIGLSGRSFVPLLSGYACAVPAMMAARNITSAKERWIANFIIPLMSCSARLPVYSLLVLFLLPDVSPYILGVAFAGIYLLSAIVGAIAAGILSKIVKRDRSGFFMMELPLYRWPRFKVIVAQSFQRTQSYVVKAGPIIFVMAILIWTASSFPRADWTVESTPEIADSYLGQAGHIIEPVFAPMGLDWRVGVGLISAFAAREVFVGTLAMVFDTTTDEEGMQDGLLAVMKTAKKSDGEPLFTPRSVAGLVIFFMIALQCMSTLAISVRESGSWKFALSQLAVLNIVAYLLAVAIVQL